MSSPARRPQSWSFKSYGAPPGCRQDREGVRWPPFQYTSNAGFFKSIKYFLITYGVPWKGTVPQRVRIPPGKLSLQPVAIGADDGGNDIVRSTSVERVALGDPATMRAATRVNAICATAHIAFYGLFPVMRCTSPIPLWNRGQAAFPQRITDCVYSDCRYAISPRLSRYDLLRAGSAESKSATAFAFLSMSISA